jgi:hypothetical protein
MIQLNAIIIIMLTVNILPGDISPSNTSFEPYQKPKPYDENMEKKIKPIATPFSVPFLIPKSLASCKLLVYLKLKGH